MRGIHVCLDFTAVGFAVRVLITLGGAVVALGATWLAGLAEGREQGRRGR